MITHVSGKLYRGPHPSDASELKKIGITLCVDLQTAWDEISFSEDVRLHEEGIAIVHLPIGDFRFPTLDYLFHILYTITNETDRGGAVYVHCTHGVDRTGLVCCLFRKVVDGWTADAAVQEWLNMGMHRFPYLWPFNWPKKFKSKIK